MNYFNLKFKVDFLGHVKNVIINILFFTMYTHNFTKRTKITHCTVYWYSQSVSYGNIFARCESHIAISKTRRKSTVLSSSKSSGVSFSQLSHSTYNVFNERDRS